MRKTLISAVLAVSLASAGVTSASAGTRPAPPSGGSNNDAAVVLVFLAALGIWIWSGQTAGTRGKSKVKTKKSANSEY